MDWDEMRKEENDLIANFKSMSDKEVIEAYTAARKKSETDRPEGVFYGRLVILVDMELQDRGFRQFLIWKKSEEEKIDCLGCGKKYTKKELMKYSKDHWYCAKCIEDDK